MGLDVAELGDGRATVARFRLLAERLFEESSVCRDRIRLPLHMVQIHRQLSSRLCGQLLNTRG